MPFSPQTIEEKPYNMCLNCAHIGKRCDGPNFLAMTPERRSEWMRLRKDYLHSIEPDKWTNAYIAETAGVSKITVSRVLSGDMKDLRISTIESVLKVLVNGTWGQYPCAMAGETSAEVVYMDSPELVKRAEESTAECERLRAMLEKMTADHKEDISTAHADDQKKIDFLREQIKFKEEQMREKDKLMQERYDFLIRKDIEIDKQKKVIRLLSVLLGVAVLIIIVALLIDRFNSDLGYFWRAAFDSSAVTSKVKL